MDDEKIQAYNEEQKRLAEREQELLTVQGVGEKLDKSLAFQTAKLIANAQSRTNKVKSVDPVASPKDIQAVVDGLNSLGDKLAPKELKPVVDTLKSVIQEIGKLPKEYPKFPAFPKFPELPKSTKVDNLKEIQPWLEAIVKAVGGLKLDPKIEVSTPDVKVPETKIDLTPITQGLIDVKKALSNIKLPATDFSALEEAVKATTKSINSLSFPVPNYILPFKDVDGKAVQVQLDADGKVPTSGSSSGGLTDAELRATPVPVSGSLTVDDTDNTASGTISTQNLVPAGAATANSTVEITLGSGQNSIAVQTVGTYTGALTLQGTVDGTNWVSFAGTPLLNANTGLWLATITSALQSVFFAKVSGFNKVRISALAAVTGSVTVSIGASAGDSFQGALGVLTTLTSITNWGNIVDNAAFTDGTTRLSPNGYIFDEVAGTALTENDAAAARVDSKRAQVFTIEDETTRGRRTTVTASNALKVDGSAVTQPVSGTVSETNSTSIKNAVEIMDDWDESDRAKVNPIVGQAGVSANVGTADATTQRTVQASGTASTLNSTTTPLTGSDTFLGAWEDVTHYDYVEALIYTDVSSGTNGAKVYFSDDGGVTTAKLLQNTITGGLGGFTYRLPVTAFTHFKVDYTNGSSAQSVFHLRVVKQSGAGEVIAPLGATVSALDSGGLVRSVQAGILPTGALGNAAYDSSSRQKITVNNFDVEVPIKALTGLKATQQSIATTATQITAAPLTSRKSISIKSKSINTQKVFIGHDNTVTASTGYVLDPGDSLDLEIDATVSIYAIASTSAQDVCIMEIA